MTEQEKYFAWKNTEHLWEVRSSWIVGIGLTIWLIIMLIKICVFNDDWAYFKKKRGAK